MKLFAPIGVVAIALALSISPASGQMLTQALQALEQLRDAIASEQTDGS